MKIDTAPAQDDTTTAEAPEAIQAPDAVFEAAAGDSLEAFRTAKKQAALAPPADAAALDDAAVAPAQPERKLTKRQEQINDYERQLAELKAENARLKTAPAQRETPPSQPSTPATAAAAPVTDEEYDRYLAMPDAPNQQKFSEAGKTFEQWQTAMQLFVVDKRWTERDQAAQRAQQERSHVERDTAQAQKFSEAFHADAEVAEMFKIITETKQWPTNGPVSEAVLSLKRFASLREGEQATGYTVIAEELFGSDDPVALAKHLSTPGELDRIAKLPTGPAITREIGRIEGRLKATAPQIPQPKLVSTAGEPTTVLSSARATDPADPLERAMRNNDPAAYKKARTAERLRAMGKT